MSPKSPPRLTILVLLHESSKQAENSLASLCPPYQDATSEAVEIVVVEASSGDMLGESRARSYGDHVRYFAINGDGAARATSLSLGLRESRGVFVGVFLDGAHVFTARALDTVTRAVNLCARPLVVIPEYRFDEEKIPGANRTDVELGWLEQSKWKKDPHLLFSAARFGSGNPNGFLGPILGAAGLFASKEQFSALFSNPIPSVDGPGAPALKLWMYTELARLRGTRLVVLAGEGAFRQHHAELDHPSVGHNEASPENLLVSAALPLDDYRPVSREPIVFGTIAAPAQRFLVESVSGAAYHCAASRKRGEPEWYTDSP